jgi:hypothetical protein
MYAGNEHSQSRKTTSVRAGNSVSLTPAVSEFHESDYQTFTAVCNPCGNVSDIKSGRVYLNPNFLKADSSLESSIAAENFPKLKHSVHINPKVLAEQAVKLNTHSQGMQPMIWDLHSELSGTKFSKTTCTSHSTTELAKQNAVVQCAATSNIVSNSGTAPLCTPRTVSPLLESSLPGPLMSISRTKLVRASQNLQDVENSWPSIPPSDVFATRHKVVRRRSVLSWSRVRRNSAGSSDVTAKAAKSLCSKYKLTRSSIAKTPATKSQYSYAINNISSGEDLKYKIDRRLHKSPKTSKKVKKYSPRYEMQKRGTSSQRIVNTKVSYRYKSGQCSSSVFKYTNKTWINSMCPWKLIVANKKLRKM